MKAIVMALVGLMPLLVMGCTQDPFLSPEALLESHQVVPPCPQDTTPGAVELLGSRQDQGRAIVMYHTTCSGADLNDPYQNYELIGNWTFARVGWQWQLQASGAVARNVDDRSKAEAEADYIDLIGGTSRKSLLHPTIKVLHGQIHSPAVKAVEVVLENGETLRDEGTKNIYAIFIPANQSPQEFRVMGHDEQVLRQEKYPFLS